MYGVNLDFSALLLFHRIGRTGRAGVRGFSLSMMDEVDLRLTKGIRDAEGDGPSAALLATRRITSRCTSKTAIVGHSWRR